VQEAWNVIMAAYLDGEISLGRAAALLGIERLNLRARLNRLGFPDRQGRQNALGTHAEYVAL
jgi:predicted HTH domain antitoxin